MAGLDTAFTATFGSGMLKRGVLAEYGGLGGMSQVGELADKKSIPERDNNHGCGHKFFATGSLAVVFAIKTYIEETMRKIYALCRESSSSKGN